MVDLSTVITAGKLALKARAYYEGLNDRNTAALLAEFDRTRDEWLIELKRAVAAPEKRLEEATAEQREKLNEVLEDPGFARVQLNYGYEAAREAIDERRGMLAYAALGAADAGMRGMSIAEVARVERTIRELDPEDVGALAHHERPPIGQPPPDTLVTAGCMMPILDSGALQLWRVTKLGEGVLRVMDLYLRAVTPEDPTK